MHLYHLYTWMHVIKAKCVSMLRAIVVGRGLVAFSLFGSVWYNDSLVEMIRELNSLDT